MLISIFSASQNDTNSEETSENDSTGSRRKRDVDTDLSSANATQSNGTGVPMFGYRTVLTRCRAYDASKASWGSNNCKVRKCSPGDAPLWL